MDEYSIIRIMTPQEIEDKIRDAEEKIQAALSEYREKMDALVSRAEQEKIARLKSEIANQEITNQ